jgi:hypothetical protein
VNGDWAWAAVILLGAYHGLNPAMGWLFAVALGLQERRREALLRALFPIALGHEASLIGVLVLLWAGSIFAAPEMLRAGGALLLIAFGAFKLARPRSHPRWVGMRVGARDLVVWSFLMSSAHGAGVMLLPIFLGPTTIASAHVGHAGHGVSGLTISAVGQDLAAALLHMATMLVVMSAVALLVYEKLGLSVLRRGWLNQDRLWAGSLVGAGVLALLLP